MSSDWFNGKDDDVMGDDNIDAGWSTKKIFAWTNICIYLKVNKTVLAYLFKLYTYSPYVLFLFIKIKKNWKDMDIYNACLYILWVVLTVLLG